MSRTEISVASGTILPSRERTLSAPMSSGRMRNAASACTFTCQLRPKRVKSFTYAEPRYTCRVSNTSLSATPSDFAFVRSMST